MGGLDRAIDAVVHRRLVHPAVPRERDDISGGDGTGRWYRSGRGEDRQGRRVHDGHLVGFAAALLAAMLDSAIVDVREAFGELRDLAHGIRPAVLTAAGLCPAAISLAGTVDLSVDVDCTLDQRCPIAVETAGYVVIAGGIDAAIRCGARRAAVSVGRGDAGLVVEVTHDGETFFPAMIDVADRVGAAGGRLLVEGRRINAEIPCES